MKDENDLTLDEIKAESEILAEFEELVWGIMHAKEKLDSSIEKLEMYYRYNPEKTAVINEIAGRYGFSEQFIDPHTRIDKGLDETRRQIEYLFWYSSELDVEYHRDHAKSITEIRKQQEGNQ